MQDKSKQWTLSQLSGYHIAKQNKKERMPWLFTIYMASSPLGKWWAKLRTGIVFNICTIQFLLPKTAEKALNWYKKLRFHNRTRIHVCNIPSFVPQNFPLERPKTSRFIYSFSSRIFRKHFCQSLHGKQPIFPYHTDTPYVGWVCCWFSPLLREVFLQVLRFPLPSKTNALKFQFNLKRIDTFHRVLKNS